MSAAQVSAESTGDPLVAARALRELIEAEAEACDQQVTLSPKVVEAVAEAKLFHVMVPADLGGAEADVSTLLDVFDELAYADGSVGWTVMANASATSYVAFLDPEIGAAMVKGRPGSTFAGQFSPFGQVAPDGDGYRVSGRFQFGSGSGHATYLGGAGFQLQEDGTPVMLEEGLPAYTCFFVPRDQTELLGNWDVLGLKGTGSFDYEVKAQHIDSGSAFYLFRPDVKVGGALFRMGAAPLAGIGHAGWGLGVARRALDEVTKIAQGGRARMGGAALRDQQVFQRELGRHKLALDSVRLLAHDVLGRTVAQLEGGDPLTKEQSGEIFGATAYLTEVAEEATLFAYRASGSQGLRNPSLVQRCFRDMFTGGLHIYVDRRSYEEVAKAQLGLE